jgi:hypothetical protein
MSKCATPNDHKDPSRLRRCLICGEHFPSEGPHNRVCRKCKNSQVWRQGC